MKFAFSFVVSIALLVMPCASQAQTLVDEWSFAGGGLEPATYGGAFRPAVLIPDAGSNGGGTVNVTGMTSGGLGSGGFPDGYGGIYTFVSANPMFLLQTSTVLSGLDTLTISFLAGGGNPSLVSYDAASLALNYNAGNTALAASEFSAVSGFVLDSPFGPQNMTLYTWTWTGLSDLGASTGFSTAWDAEGQQHVFFGDISATQSVPEPSVLGLIVLGGAAVALRRERCSVLALP